MAWHPLGPDPDEHELSQDDMMRILAGKITPENLIYQRERAIREEKDKDDIRWILHNFRSYVTHLTTRELIEMLRSYQRGNTMFYARPIKAADFQYCGYINIGDIWGNDGNIFGENSYRSVIKDELATRPHLRNKGDGRTNRRKLATKNRGQNKSKNR